MMSLFQVYHKLFNVPPLPQVSQDFRMSDPQRLIVNCGASQVTVAIVSISDGNLQIDKLVTKELQCDLSNEEKVFKNTGEALRDLSHRYKISGRATMIVPGNLTLARTIKIPHVEEPKLRQIIAFEVQKKLPYSINQVVWDSQVVSDDGVEIKTLFVAARSRIINCLHSCMLTAGFTVEKISAGTVLDYNALRFAYPELDDVLLINIGARSTNLTFTSKDGFHTRNIQLGGNSLTQGIADSLGSSFTVAEQVKREFFAKDTSYFADDSRLKLLNSCTESFVRRMNQEINLSIANYCHQKDGFGPKQILLTGRGSCLKGLAEGLSVAQKVEVSFFDPLKNVILEGSIDADTDVLRLQTSEIIGEACREMSVDASGVNLLPDNIQAEITFSSKKPFIFAAAACLALAPLLPLLSYVNANGAYSEQVRVMESKLIPMQYNQAEINNCKTDALKITQSIQRVEGLVNSKSNWVCFLTELQQSLHQAEDVWIDRLDVVRDSTTEGGPACAVLVEGKLLVREAVNGAESIDETILSDQLSSLRSSFEGSEFVVSTRSPTITWTNLRLSLYVLPFSISLTIDPSRPL